MPETEVIHIRVDKKLMIAIRKSAKEGSRNYQQQINYMLRKQVEGK